MRSFKSGAIMARRATDGHALRQLARDGGPPVESARRRREMNTWPRVGNPSTAVSRATALCGHQQLPAQSSSIAAAATSSVFPGRRSLPFNTRRCCRPTPASERRCRVTRTDGIAATKSGALESPAQGVPCSGCRRGLEVRCNWVLYAASHMPIGSRFGETLHCAAAERRGGRQQVVPETLESWAWSRGRGANRLVTGRQRAVSRVPDVLRKSQSKQ
jgi:hypothetical protein